MPSCQLPVNPWWSPSIHSSIHSAGLTVTAHWQPTGRPGGSTSLPLCSRLQVPTYEEPPPASPRLSVSFLRRTRGMVVTPLVTYIRIPISHLPCHICHLCRYNVVQSLLAVGYEEQPCSSSVRQCAAADDGYQKSLLLTCVTCVVGTALYTARTNPLSSSVMMRVIRWG